MLAFVSPARRAAEFYKANDVLARKCEAVKELAGRRFQDAAIRSPGQAKLRKPGTIPLGADLAASPGYPVPTGFPARVFSSSTSLRRTPGSQISAKALFNWRPSALLMKSMISWVAPRS